MPSDFSDAWRQRDHLAARVRPLDDVDWEIISRQLAKRTNGVFASVKNDRSVPWRTREERDLMRLLEVSPEVIGYESWPERVDYIADSKRRRHVPAVRATTERGTVVMDVFRDDGPHAVCLAEIAEVMGDTYARRGVRYVALTPREVRLEPRFGNALHVLDRRTMRPAPGDELRVVEALTRRGGSATVADLRGLLGDAAEAVFPMAMRRSVRLDLSAAEPSLIGVSLRVGGLA